MKTLYINAIARYSDDWNLKTIITDANMRRRMSRMVKMGVAAGLQCLANDNVVCPDAIITASGLGCLSDSEKFLSALIANNEQQLPPTPFIQSTFNTIGSQIAILTNCTNYNMTYVNGLTSFDSALFDGLLTAADGAQSVLVGVADELTPSLLTILERLNIADAEHYPTDGAVFFMISAKNNQNTMAEISSVEMLPHKPMKLPKGAFPTDSAMRFYNIIERKQSGDVLFDNFKITLKC